MAAEALLCETPVIAFRSGGLTDIVRDGDTGMLVEPGKTLELALALDRVLSQPQEASDLAKRGHQHVLDTFSPEIAAQRYMDIYTQAIAQP